MNRFTAHIALEPVFSAQGRSFFRPSHEGPIFRGGGESNYTCPHCGHVLAELVPESQIFDLVLECGICRELCEFARLPPGAKAAGGYVFVPARPYQLGQTIELAPHVLMIGEGAITGGGSPFWN
jgi:hypothetical protein